MAATNIDTRRTFYQNTQQVTSTLTTTPHKAQVAPFIAHDTIELAGRTIAD